MSSTIGNLVDRVYREYLEPVDKVESYSYLSSGINDSVDSITYDGNLFSIEEEDPLGIPSTTKSGVDTMSRIIDLLNPYDIFDESSP